MTRLYFILMVLGGLFSCDDEIPYDLKQPEAGQQKVLVEEISGVRCPNCPDGSRLLEALNADFDSSLVIVTYHAGSFSIPYKESRYDFKTDQTVALMEYLGRPIGYPSAAIQRIPLQDQSTYQRFPNTWTTTISEVLNSEPGVDLNLSVDTLGSVVNLHLSALFLRSVSAPVYLTAYLTESGLVDPQADTRAGDEHVPDYVHDHVLREVLTPVTGLLWGEGFQELDFREDSLRIDFESMPRVVDRSRTSFVVFLHTRSGVLQVEKIETYPR